MISTSFSAPTEPVATLSPTQTAIVYLPNGGTIGSISVVTQGVANLDFNYVAGGAGAPCVVGNTYEKGLNCSVSYTFKPTAPGMRMGAVNVYDNSPMPVLLGSVYLNGIGTGPLVAFSPATQTVLSMAGLLCPAGIAADAEANLFVVDACSGTVYKETLSGAVTCRVQFRRSGRPFPTTRSMAPAMCISAVARETKC